MSHPRLPHLFAILVLISSMLPARAQANDATALPDLETVGTLGEQLFLKSGATGMVLVMVRGNQVLFRGYGETAPGSHQIPAQESVVRLCSLTKTFTTDVLAKLAADGTLKLSGPLRRYAPKGAVVPRRVRPITLEELATHTSGLPRELGSRPRDTARFAYPDRATRWRWLPKQRLRSMPGTAALYSNVGFDLLSDALEAAAHKPYAALLAERTLNPLGMRNTTFYPNVAQCGLLLQGVWNEGACTVTEQTEGSAGLYSTAADMTIWLKYLLGTGGAGAAAQAVYVKPETLTRLTGLDHAGEPSGVGLGWIHLLPEDSPSHLVEKTGGGAGFTTYIAINHAHATALFLAATDGAEGLRVNVFKEANNLLLAAAGLPELRPEPVKHAVRKARPHRAPRRAR